MKKILFIAIALALLGIGAWVLMPKDAAPSPTAPLGEESAGAVSTSTTSATESSSDTSETSSAAPAPAPAPKPSGYTMAEVSAHADASSCWTAIEGNVYDLTAWISKHPGGKSAILRLCGVDGTQEFNDQHGGQGKPERELASYKIGALI